MKRTCDITQEEFEATCDRIMREQGQEPHVVRCPNLDTGEMEDVKAYPRNVLLRAAAELGIGPRMKRVLDTAVQVPV